MSKVESDSEKRRLLVIGIDGATYDLLDPMIARGWLPNLAALMQRGVRARLHSTIPPNSAAAWATFMTGKNPGQHGILRFQATRPSRELGREFRPGAYTFVNAASIPGRRIWNILGDAGKRVAVINCPMTYPPQPLNGIMVAGLMTPPGAKDFTYPPELAESLGDYRIEQPMATMGFGRAANRELVRVSHEILEQQGDAALNLLKREPWDFFFVVFTGTDRIQHRLWNYLEQIKDEKRMRNVDDEAESPASGDGLPDIDYFREHLPRYYGLLDSIVGRLIEAAGEQGNCVVLSDHGFGPAPRLAIYRRALARRLGLEAGEGVGGFHSLRAWLERHSIMDGDRLRRWLAGTPFRRLLSRVSRLARRKEQEAWRESRAYLVVLHKYVGGIGINLDPTDPEYEPLRSSLAEKLAEVRDPDSDKVIVTRIWRREEIFHGPRLAACPDVVFRIEERYGFAHGESPGGQLVCPKDFRSQGIHRDEGVLVLAGPDVVKDEGGRMKDEAEMRNDKCEMMNEKDDKQGVAERFVEVQDVTATALYLLDVPIPADMDGRVIEEAIRPSRLASHPVRRETATEEAAPSSVPEASWQSIEDEEAVADRLRELGYLD